LVQAQTAPKDEDRVTIALVDQAILRDGNVFISRKTYGHERNLVLLGRKFATSGVLEHAMQQLVISRAKYGRVPKHSQGIVMHDATKGSSDPATQELFQQLLSAAPREVPGYGTIQAVTIHLTRDVP